MTREEFEKGYRIVRQVEECENDLVILKATRRYRVVGDHRQLDNMGISISRRFVELDRELRDIIIKYYEGKLLNLKKELAAL